MYLFNVYNFFISNKRALSVFIVLPFIAHTYDVFEYR